MLLTRAPSLYFAALVLTAGTGWALLRQPSTAARAARLYPESALPAPRGLSFEAAGQPPTHPGYTRAVEMGRRDMRRARSLLLSLAREHAGTETGAWSLYQSVLASRALRDRAAAEAGLRELRTRYPGHPLALRLAAPAPGPAARVSAVDCGPIALRHVLRRAGVHADLAMVRARCGTDRTGTSLAGLRQGALSLGRSARVRAVAVQADALYLERHRPSGIAWVEGDHFVAFEPAARAGHFQVYDPAAAPREGGAAPAGAGTTECTAGALTARSGGVLLLLGWKEGPGRSARPLPPALPATQAARFTPRPRAGSSSR